MVGTPGRPSTGGVVALLLLLWAAGAASAQAPTEPTTAAQPAGPPSTAAAPSPGGAGQESADAERLRVTSHRDGEHVASRVLKLQGYADLPEPVRAVLEVGFPDGSRERTRVGMGRGVFTAYAALKPGDNLLSLRAIDGGGGRWRQDLTLRLGSTADAASSARALVLTEPRPGATVPTTVLKVAGTVTAARPDERVTLTLDSAGRTTTKSVATRGGAFQAYFVLTGRDNTVTVATDDLVETVSVICESSRVAQPEPAPSAEPGDRPVPRATPATRVAPRPTATAAAAAALPAVQILAPVQDALLPSSVLKVEGMVRNASVHRVRARLVSDAEEAKEFPVSGGAFRGYFVVRSPFAVLTVTGLDDAGAPLGEDAVEVRCAKPKGFEGPLPWEDEPRPREPVPPPRPPDAPPPRSFPPEDPLAEAESAGATAAATDPWDDVAWQVVVAPLMLFVMLPVIVVRGRIILRKLFGKVMADKLSRLSVPCEFCKASAVRYFLFSLDLTTSEAKAALQGVIDCASATSIEVVNQELRGHLEQAQRLGAATRGTTKVSCVWCRGCRSGLLLVGEGAERKRHPILTPVFFDWVLVTLSLPG